MKAVLHGLAMVAIVLVSALCLLIQVANVDHAIDRVTSRDGSSSGR